MTPWLLTLPCLHHPDFKPGEAYHCARFERETRYYVMRLEKDIFDNWIISVTNGRIGSRLGQSRTVGCSHFAETFEQFCLMTKIRSQRGYHLISWQTDNLLYLYILCLCMAEQNQGTTCLIGRRKRTDTLSKQSLPMKRNLPGLQNNIQLSLSL